MRMVSFTYHSLYRDRRQFLPFLEGTSDPCGALSTSPASPSLPVVNARVRNHEMVIKYEQESKGVPRIYVGRIVHAKSLKHLEILPKAALGVREDGTISFLKAEIPDTVMLGHEYASEGFAEATTIYLRPSKFLFPGMIDAHLHAPQWPNLALGMEGDLKEWVEHYTDPMEVCRCRGENG